MAGLEGGWGGGRDLQEVMCIIWVFSCRAEPPSRGGGGGGASDQTVLTGNTSVPPAGISAQVTRQIQAWTLKSGGEAWNKDVRAAQLLQEEPGCSSCRWLVPHQLHRGRWWWWWWHWYEMNVYSLSRNLSPSQLLGGDLCRTEFMVHLFGTIEAHTVLPWTQSPAAVCVCLRVCVSINHPATFN